eukprot:scaffold663827_cov61-Prasinocladus_malaysianus.AAC.1
MAMYASAGDVVLGFCLGANLAFTWSHIDVALYHMVQTAPTLAWVYALLFCGAIILLYPRPMHKDTPCRDQVICFAGVAFGALIGAQLSSDECLSRTAWPSPPYGLLAGAGRAVCRYVLGGSML